MDGITQSTVQPEIQSCLFMPAGRKLRDIGPPLDGPELCFLCHLAFRYRLLLLVFARKHHDSIFALHALEIRI